MKIVGDEDVRGWYAHSPSLSSWTHSIGQTTVEPEWIEAVLGVPLHLRVVIDHLRKEREGDVPRDALDSIPFFSLCKGLFVPLSGLTRDRVAQLFGMDAPEPPTREAREALVRNLFAKNIGLSLEQKLGCVLGDAFLGRPSTFRRDSLLRLLQTAHLVRRNDLLDRLARVGDVAILFAELQPKLHESPPLTAAEVLETLRILPDLKRNDWFAMLSSVLERCGKLEAFFLSKLLLRKASFGFDYQGELLCRMVAEAYGADPAQVSHAAALTDIFHVARVLREEGKDGLRSIELKPLVPVRPALAGGLASEITRYPVWVERKYDGIRFTLHKSTDRSGARCCAGPIPATATIGWSW